ncbi:MAG TPA: hypothetical protein VLX92_02150, partial [Kofleriaceae bacterium]|nr:hypothetical protein [Kofleriaceae bacterium]
AGHSFDVTRAGALNTIGHFTGGLAPIHANGFYIDVRVHPAPHWYVGIDLGAAFGGSVNPAFAARGGDTITWDSSSVMTMAAVAGARLPLGPLSLRAEVVAGIHGAELGSMTDTPQGLAASTVAPLVAPRVAADLWIHRWWVIEAYAGVNALDRSERMFGLGLGFHSQAFDGRR